MRGQLLRDADWAGMAHGVEIRTPLVDATLFRQVGRGGFTKRQMAETPLKPLPHEVLNRPKSGFFVPVQEWLGARERGLRGWAREVYASQVA
jgi:asparagine synthase (glutamine-hydrolysing)